MSEEDNIHTDLTTGDAGAGAVRTARAPDPEPAAAGASAPEPESADPASGIVAQPEAAPAAISEPGGAVEPEPTPAELPEPEGVAKAEPDLAALPEPVPAEPLPGSAVTPREDATPGTAAAAPAPEAGERPPSPAGETIAPVPEAPREPRWYVLRVQAGREDFVKRNLDKMARSEGLSDRILRVLIPSELVSEMKGRKKTVKERKLYPGYIMVQMLADEETIYHVRGTQGVGDFVGGGATNAPDPLPEHEVERILGAAEKGTEEPKLNIQFKKGQSVKIKNGPFENFTGVVEEVSPTKGTIRVIVTIFGRATPIEVEYWEVEAI